MPVPGAPEEGKIALNLDQLFFEIVNTEYVPFLGT